MIRTIPTSMLSVAKSQAQASPGVTTTQVGTKTIVIAGKCSVHGINMSNAYSRLISYI